MAETFRIHEVAAGVWAAVAPDTSGPAVSNAAIVDLGGVVVVVDTFMTETAAVELAAAAGRLTGGGPDLVVNTHFHADHVGGNHVFPRAPVIGTPRMRELIAADPGAGRLPDVLMGKRLDLAGERRATILGHGPAHTESDLLVHLPDDGVLIAGDLVWTGVHPKTSDGVPAAWAAVVERLDALAAAHVVPGHGLPGGPADLAAMAAYLRELDGMVAAARSGDLDPAGAAPPAGSEGWRDVERFRKELGRLAAG